MINAIDVYLVSSGNRELSVSQHKMHSTSFTQSVMVDPRWSLEDIIILELKEQDTTGRLNNNALVTV